MKYKISIIIPVYNTEKYLSRAIESVLRQEFDDFEIIIVDDGSTDSSRFIADNYSLYNDNITVIHKENEGLGFARNTGLKCANGDYILFLDSDDYIDKNTLKRIYCVAKNTNADITVFNMRKISEKDNSVIEEEFLKLKQETISIKEMGINNYFKCYFFPYIHGHEACNKLYKKTLLQKSRILFDKNDLICSEDFARQYTNLEFHIYDANSINQVFEKLKELNDKQIVVTMGEKGLLYEDGDIIKHMPAFKCKPVDTTGAGDIFHGAFAHCLAKDYTLEESLKISSMTSAISVETMGGQVSIPSFTEVIERIKNIGE